MKITAIIAEYNPLTNGHISHISKARAETGADCILAVMSGSYTQRGEGAIADKYLRAATAVKCGVDIVCELPTIYAISSAEQFAYGAVKMLSGIKEIEYISFGSECGDITLLETAAQITDNEPERLSELLKEGLADGLSFPKAYAKAFDEYCATTDGLLHLRGIYDGANNTLGIAYIIAAKRLDFDVKFHTVARIGGSYDDNATDVQNPSASAVRTALFEGKLNSVKNAIPLASYELLGVFRGSSDALGDMALCKLKQISGYELVNYHGFDGKEGLHNRIKIAADSSSTYEQFLEKAKTKKYTLARIKRLTLSVLLDVKESFFKKALFLPNYYNVLAINKKLANDILSTLSYLPNVMLKYSDSEKKIDKAVRPLAKLDWEAQGVLSIINRDVQYNRVMLSVE